MRSFIAVSSLLAIVCCSKTSLTRTSTACKCMCGISGRTPRIVGGEESSPHEFPWMANLYYGKDYYCGASLITPRHLLTAAHCLYRKNISQITVGLGDHNRNLVEVGEKKMKLKRMTMHPNFTLTKVSNDIGMLELESPVDVNGRTIRTVCLPQKSDLDYSGMTGVVTGWGKEKEGGSSSEVLRKVVVPLISSKECSTNFGYSAKRIHDTNFCAGFPEGTKDSCQGDSGGPIHLVKDGSYKHMEIIGIVSWGRGCARPRYPGVYTRVDKYLPWISKIIGSECLCSPPI